jgi:glycosyltransferase involved in cell wall biosynthesis
MSSSPAVSVVLPVFNAGSRLRRAVQSILDQDLTDFELILIDDASSDQSAAIAQDMAESDPRVRFVSHRQNQGLAGTLNEGIQLARAPFIARMDQDDESLQQRLGIQVAYLSEHAEVAVAGSFVYHMGARPRFDHLIELPIGADEVRRTLKQYNCLYHSSVMFRRTAVERAGGYRTDFGNAEDYELWLRLSQKSVVCNIPVPLLRYRFSLGGMTLSRKWQQLYYVYLAQTMHAGGPLPLATAESRAAKMLTGTDRRYFLGEVAKGTVAELLLLRLWRDAARLIVTYQSEIDPLVCADLSLKVLHHIAAERASAE